MFLEGFDCSARLFWAVLEYLLMTAFWGSQEVAVAGVAKEAHVEVSQKMMMLPRRDGAEGTWSGTGRSFAGISGDS